MSPGFRILPAPPRPAQALVERFRGVVVAHLSDNMHRLAAVDAGVRPYHRGGSMVGVALTVKVPPGDNLMVHKALDLIAPGDVVVVDAGGLLAQAIIGEIMSSYAAMRGAAGMVIDGAVRDRGALARSDFPVYARGVTHRGPYKNGPGEIHVPVSIGGLVVHPGDIVVGDDDGLVAVRPDEADAVLAAAARQCARETETLAAIAARRPIDRGWIDEALRAKGVLPPPR